MAENTYFLCALRVQSTRTEDIDWQLEWIVQKGSFYYNLSYFRTKKERLHLLSYLGAESQMESMDIWISVHLQIGFQWEGALSIVEIIFVVINPIVIRYPLEGKLMLNMNLYFQLLKSDDFNR